MNNKLMLFIEVPLIEKELNILVPMNRKIGNIVEEIVKYINVNLASNNFPQGNYSLFDKRTGKIISNNVSVRNSNLRNAQVLVLA